MNLKYYIKQFNDFKYFFKFLLFFISFNFYSLFSFLHIFFPHFLRIKHNKKELQL